MKASLQFKLSIMFFVVMAISASISITVLLLIFNPTMQDSAEMQLKNIAISIDKLSKSKEKYSTEEILTLINTSSLMVTELDKKDPLIIDNIYELQTNSYSIVSEGVIPNAIMVIKIKNEYYKVDSFSKDNMYSIINLIIIVAFIASIILGTIITGFVSKTILQPIRDLNRATSEVARGNFSVRVEVPNDKEYSSLVNNFNKMTHELSSIETLRGDFISNVSHEFKTPLASIQGFAKLLQSDNLSKEDQKEYSQIIINETDRLTKLSTNILRLTKLENQTSVGKKTRFSLDEQIRNIILILEPEWSKKNIDLDINLEDIMYVGNSELMGQIWQNIINNAIKFTPENGTIKVDLFRSDTCIMVKISDNGPGISKEMQQKIFEKFYQADHSRATEGNGLGLALVKRIVDLCKGKVSVENLYEGGVCFNVELPYIIEDMK